MSYGNAKDADALANAQLVAQREADEAEPDEDEDDDTPA